MGRRTSIATLCAFGVVVAITGCGTAKQNTTPVSTPTTTPASAISADGAAAVAAYEGMWTDMANAGETANWRDPALGAHATDSALDAMVKLLREDDKDGAVLQGRPTMHPKITSEEPTSAPTVVTLSDCLGMQNWLLHRRSSGALWDNKPGTNRATTAEVVLSQGAWKVVSFDVASSASC